MIIWSLIYNAREKNFNDVIDLSDFIEGFCFEFALDVIFDFFSKKLRLLLDLGPFLPDGRSR